MNKFKVGDEVIIDNTSGTCVTCHSYNKFIGQKFKIVTIIGCGKNARHILTNGYGNWYESELKFPNDLSGLKVGDVIEKVLHHDGNVVAVLGSVIFIQHDTKDIVNAYTVDILHKSGWKKKDTEVETITISGKTYNKRDVDNRLAELKVVK